jgi:hypothetical protein
MINLACFLYKWYQMFLSRKKTRKNHIPHRNYGERLILGPRSGKLDVREAITTKAHSQPQSELPSSRELPQLCVSQRRRFSRLHESSKSFEHLDLGAVEVVEKAAISGPPLLHRPHQKTGRAKVLRVQSAPFPVFLFFPGHRFLQNRSPGDALSIGIAPTEVPRTSEFRCGFMTLPGTWKGAIESCRGRRESSPNGYRRQK